MYGSRGFAIHRHGPSGGIRSGVSGGDGGEPPRRCRGVGIDDEDESVRDVAVGYIHQVPPRKVVPNYNIRNQQYQPYPPPPPEDPPGYNMGLGPQSLPRKGPAQIPKVTQYRRRHRYPFPPGGDDGGDWDDWGDPGRDPDSPRGWPEGDPDIGVPGGRSDIGTGASLPGPVPRRPQFEHSSLACRHFRESLYTLPRGLHLPRIAETVEKHPDVRRYREFCFGKSPADVCKFWRHEKGQGKGKGQGQGPPRRHEDYQGDQVDPTTRALER